MFGRWLSLGPQYHILLNFICSLGAKHGDRLTDSTHKIRSFHSQHVALINIFCEVPVCWFQTYNSYFFLAGAPASEKGHPPPPPILNISIMLALLFESCRCRVARIYIVGCATEGRQHPLGSGWLVAKPYDPPPLPSLRGINPRCGWGGER
jgi:hypothetical protein